MSITHIFNLGDRVKILDELFKGYVSTIVDVDVNVNNDTMYGIQVGDDPDLVVYYLGIELQLEEEPRVIYVGQTGSVGPLGK